MNVMAGWSGDPFRRLNSMWVRGLGVAPAGAFAPRIERSPSWIGPPDQLCLPKEWKTSMARGESFSGSSSPKISGGDPALADLFVRFRADT